MVRRAALENLSQRKVLLTSCVHKLSFIIYLSVPIFGLSPRRNVISENQFAALNTGLLKVWHAGWPVVETSTVQT